MTTTTEDRHGCHYVCNYIAVPPEHLEAAVDLLDDAYIADAKEVDEAILGDGADPEITSQILTEIVGVLRVSDDPLEEARRLRENGIPASPIHAVGFASHLSFKPGTDPDPVKRTIDGFPRADPDKIVAVIDSGIVEERYLPDWLGSSVMFDPVDVESLNRADEASHGTFVSGLIRMIARDHSVSMARVRRKPIDTLCSSTKHGPGDVAPDPTTELDVVEAILRLIHRHSGDYVVALNLSLGAYACDECNDPMMVALSQALARWRREQTRATVFAAAGNRPDFRRVFPGAFPEVRAVAAATDGGQQVVWDDSGNILPAPSRSWVTDVAPGSDLIGPSGKGPQACVAWSGSSFASAVAASSHADGRSNEAHAGLTWWEDRTVDYASYQGLVYR